eukprot:2017632-Ditylum_brightwellii.AAC.1
MDGVYPRHSIDIMGKGKAEVQALLDPKIQASAIVPQPQSMNMVLEFNNRVTLIVSSLCKKEGTASLVSVAADGAGCDAKFIQGQLVSFLQGN